MRFLGFLFVCCALLVPGLIPGTVMAQSAIGQLERISGGSVGGWSGPTPTYSPVYDAAAAQARAEAAQARAEAAAARQAQAAVRRAEAAKEREQRQRQRDREDQARRDERDRQKEAEESARQREEFRKSLEPARTLLQSVPLPPPVTAQTSSVGEARALRIGGLTEAEWAEARKCQQEIDRITSVWPVPGKELAALEQWELKRNRLWTKAISVPGLTAREREQLRLKLHTRDVYAAAPAPVHLTTSEIETIITSPKTRSADRPLPPGTEPSPPSKGAPVPTVIRSVLSGLASDKAEEMIDESLENAGESLLRDGVGAPDKVLSWYGSMLEVSKIAVAFSRSTVSGITETIDLMVSKITLPRAKEAIEGGRFYGSVTAKSYDEFLRQTNLFMSQMGGGTLDTETYSMKAAGDGSLARKVGVHFLLNEDDD
jgi:hypothetical protein